MPKVYILVGIPCSGKTTWFKKYEKAQEFILSEPLMIISRDIIRDYIQGFECWNKWIYNKVNEDRVTKECDKLFEIYTSYNYDIVIDNTHCKQTYIDDVKSKIPLDYQIEIKYFDIPLWKAYYRNIKRWILSGKYIPAKVLKSMHKNYKNLKK